MHSRPARHKTLPQKQKCIWERRIWRKKLQKEKIHAKIPATGRTAAGTGFGSFLRAAALRLRLRSRLCSKNLCGDIFLIRWNMKQRFDARAKNTISIHALYLQS